MFKLLLVALFWLPAALSNPNLCLKKVYGHGNGNQKGSKSCWYEGSQRCEVRPFEASSYEVCIPQEEGKR